MAINGRSRAGSEEAEDDSVAFEIACKMIGDLSPLGHVLELLCLFFSMVEAAEVDGFADFASLPPAASKPRAGPGYEYLSALPAWQKAQPKVADEMRRRGIGPWRSSTGPFMVRRPSAHAPR